MTTAPSVRVERLVDRPIIASSTHSGIGVNIQGPSLIRVPEWIERPLGRYYLYFADHKGRYIRLAYADELTGPWRIHEPGSLQLTQTPFPKTTLTAPPALVRAAEARMKTGEVRHENSIIHELTTPHIASPDAHVDADKRRIVMYYHGLEAPGRQVSRAAVSKDGIAFSAGEKILGRSYMRIFGHDDMTYALAMPGQFYRSFDPLNGFEEGPVLFNPNMRHSAVLVRGDTLYVFWTQVGDVPERILLSTVDVRGDWRSWRQSDAVEALRPERSWEGALAPLEPSIRGLVNGQVNQLRDPAVYVEDEVVYLLYAVAGESGIGIAKVAL